MTKQDLVDNLGKVRGHFKDKSNRIAKLVFEWPELESKMDSFVQRGQTTYHARLAYAVLLMMETGIRTGNETSAEGWICQNEIIARKDNPQKSIKKGDVIWRHPQYGQFVQTFGLTTLQHRHIRRYKTKLRIDFVGKKLVDQSIFTRHPTLIRLCPRGKSNELFLDITYNDLKKFVKKYVGCQYTPKDLRMAKANLVFIDLFAGRLPCYIQATTKRDRKQILGDTIEQTASIIGHTKSVCKSAYLSQPLLGFITNQ
jgi:DNA topoisomerase IB